MSDQSPEPDETEEAPSRAPSDGAVDAGPDDVPVEAASDDVPVEAASADPEPDGTPGGAVPDQSPGTVGSSDGPVDAAAEVAAPASASSDDAVSEATVAGASSDDAASEAAPADASSDDAVSEATVADASSNESAGGPDVVPSAPDGDEGTSFAGLGLRPELLGALAALGYEEPTPIQGEAMPHLLAGRDVLGQAATGTGKTAAFALPLLHRLAERARQTSAPMALVLVPTRELAVQVSEAVHRYGRPLGARVAPVYGGQPISRQLRALQSGVDVVVATPGRALDHVSRGSLDLTGIEAVVLDEADEMLDMGFAEDIESLLAATPRERQTVLFSATLPPRIAGMARKHLRDPVRIEIGRAAPTRGEAPLVRQVAYVVARAHKAAALGRVLDVEAPTAALVFCRTRTEVDALTETLNGRGYRAEALHGGMGQEQRERVLGRLRTGTAELLIATDVAARGLDVEVLSHVVNYDVPSAAETYVHRIGRVGRAGRTGVAITLAEPREHRLLKNIERLTGQRLDVAKVPSVADLHARRLELTVGMVRDRLEQGDLDRFRGVVEALAEDFDVLEVALASIALASEASASTGDETEIPDAVSRPPRNQRDGDRGRSRGDGPPRRDQGERGGWDRDAGRGGSDGPRSRGGDRNRGEGDGQRRRGPSGPTTRLFIGVGRSAGIRPQDLVGAITGEAGLAGRDIGAIEITDRFSLVEVPASVADGVVASLRGATIKGRRANVRRERFDPSR